jgi:hypothetical protein
MSQTHNLDGTPVSAGIESYGLVRISGGRPPYPKRKPVDLSMYKYPWGNVDPNEPYEVIDPITRGGWFKSEWASQPLEVKALGKVAGYYAVEEANHKLLERVDAAIEAETAHMTDEQFRQWQGDQAEALEEYILRSNERNYGKKAPRH